MGEYHRLRQDGILRQQINGINQMQQQHRLFQSSAVGRQSGDQHASSTFVPDGGSHQFNSPQTDYKKKQQFHSKTDAK